MATDDVGGDTVAVSLRRVWACVATGHGRRGGTAAKISSGGLAWALAGIVCQHLTVARIAEGLGVSWSCANTAVLDEGRRVLIGYRARFGGVAVLGVDTLVLRTAQETGRRTAHRGQAWGLDPRVNNERTERVATERPDP